MSLVIRTFASSLAARLPRLLLAAALPALAACAGAPARNDTPDAGSLLRDSLPVAAAALAAGQLDAARRLYLSLAERFPDAPEPALGLAYIAWYSGNLAAAEQHFLKAADLAGERRELVAEARLGAGRVALARGGHGKARRIFEAARDPARDTPVAPWILNGLAVAASMDGDYEAADAHYAEALRISPENPRIVANHVRTLLGAGKVADAARMHAARPGSFWKDEDGATLSRLIEEARRKMALARAAVASGDSPASRAPGGSPAPSPGGSRPELREVVDPGEPRPPPPNLTLRLSDFSLSPSGPAVDAPLAPSDPSELVLRIADWPGPITPPALNGQYRHASYWPADPATPSPGPHPSERPASVPAEEPLPPEAETAKDPSLAEPSPAEPSVAEAEAAEEPFPAAIDETTIGAGVPEPPPPETLSLNVGQSHRLLLEREATAVSVAAPEIADVQLLSPTVLYIIGRAVGRTSVSILAGDDWNEEHLVSVGLDLAPLRAALGGVPDLDGVRVLPNARGATLGGEVVSAEAADRALRIATATLPEGVPIENELRIAGPQQVNLEVQIAEVNRSVTENLGVSWEAFQGRGQNALGVRIGRLVTSSTLELSNAPFGFSPLLVEESVAPSLAFGRQTASGRIGAMIDALSTAGLANVLARPNVTAISGESASFFSGGEFPLPSGFDAGVLTFEYKKYGVLLDFVPTVVDSGRIVLTVRPEVSEPSLTRSIAITEGVNVPVINVRRAETTVEVANGESIVIAGLFRNASNTVEAGVPGLKDLPLLGALFGKSTTRSDELELIVIVTARLVHAIAARDDTLAPPTGRRASGFRY